jgi:hypothetical protein
MPNINIKSRSRKIFRTKDGDTWEPFQDDKQVNVVIGAFMVINTNVIWDEKILKTCNCAFAKLAGHRDFATVWRDPEVWVSLNSNPATDIFGMTYKKEISIPIRLFSIPEPVRVIAATLVHELAHVNGAPGGWTDSKEAESTLPPCGFDDQYNPVMVGSIRRPKQIIIT